MTARPRVTLGVPVYNGERYLSVALASLMEQDHDSLEILVSDNASTDGTRDIVASATAADSRVRAVHHEVNRGGVWNVNFLVHEARGSLFKWAYYDDVCAPTLVSSSVAALDQAGPGAVLSYTRALTIDQSGVVIEERRDGDLGLDAPDPALRVRRLLQRLANQCEFGLMRTEVVRQTRLVRPFIGSEMFFLTEMAMRGRFVLVPEPLLRLRRHPEQYGNDRFSEAGWYAQSGQRMSLLPFTRMNWLLAQTAATGPLSPLDRARAVVAVGRGWTVPRRRSLASDVRHLPRTWRARRAAEAHHG